MKERKIYSKGRASPVRREAKTLRDPWGRVLGGAMQRFLSFKFIHLLGWTGIL